MRILSSAEKCRRVARRIFFTTSVAGSFSGTDFCLIFAPCESYDEPEILPSSTHPICLMSADGGHLQVQIGQFPSACHCLAVRYYLCHDSPFIRGTCRQRLWIEQE